MEIEEALFWDRKTDRRRGGGTNKAKGGQRERERETQVGSMTQKQSDCRQQSGGGRQKKLTEWGSDR